MDTRRIRLSNQLTQGEVMKTHRMKVTGAESRDGVTAYHIEASKNPLDYINQLREALLGIVWDADGVPIEYPTQEAVNKLLR